MKIITSLLFGFLLLSANANVTIDYTQKLPWEKSFVRGKLDNGLQYTIAKAAYPKDRAVLYLYIGAGSLEEEEDQRGVAHFIEHMAFNGTKNFAKNDLVSYLESIGMKFGGDLNANTGFERTVYTLSLPLGDDHLQKCLMILREWAGNVTIDKDEFDKERGVILEEKRFRNSVGYRLYMQTMPIYFGGSRYMHRVPIGLESVLKNITADRAREFYRKWYRPELMHIVAVGDFNKTAVESMIREKFSDLKNHSSTPLASRDIPDRNKTVVITATDKELTYNSLSIIYIDDADHIESVKNKKKALIKNIVFMLLDIKAREQMLKNDPKATRIVAYSSPYAKYRHSHGFAASYKDGDAAEALKELYAFMWSFARYGFSANDFELAKRSIYKNIEKARQKIPTLRSDVIAGRIIKALEQDGVYIDYDYDYNLTKKLLSEITLDDINNYYRGILSIQNRAVLFIDSSGNGLDLNQTVSILDEAKNSAVDMSKQQKTSLSLLDKAPKRGRIVSKKYNKDTGIYSYSLENGIKVDFRPSKLQKNMFYLRASSKGGSSVLNEDEFMQMRYAPLWIDRSAPADFTSTDISRILSGKNVSVRLGISRFSDEITAIASTLDAKEAFELLYAKVTMPKLDTRIYNNGKKQVSELLKQADKDPAYLFDKLVAERYFDNDYRIRPESLDDIERLDRDKMINIYKERFADMNSFYFAISGDMEPAQIEDLISLYLASLPTMDRDETYDSSRYKYKKGYHKVHAELNTQNSATVNIEYRSSMPFSYQKQMIVNALKETLSNRLRNRIREDKSGTYNVSVWAEMQAELKDAVTFAVSFKTDPKKVFNLIETVKKEIEEIKRSGVTHREIEDYKKGVMVEFRNGLNYDEFWLAAMVESNRFGIELKDLMNVEVRLKNINPKEVQEAANIVFGKDVLESVLLPKKENK